MSSGAPVKRFSDFAADDRPLAGDKVKIETVLNKEILITGYRVTASKYGKSNSASCLTVQFESDGKQQVIFTGSGVLINQLEKYSSELPFLATIKKIDRYYTLT